MKTNKYVIVHPPNLFDDTGQGLKTLEHKRSERPRDGKNQIITAGIWDLGAWLGMLPEFVDKLNSIQDNFVFFEIKAPVPIGLISHPKGMISWLTDLLRRKVKRSEIRDIKNNLIANDFFEISETIRSELKIDYIIGITPSMVAGVDSSDEVYWNHFSSFSKKSILASSFGLREYAQETGLTFSAFLISIILPQLLTAMYWPKLGFHEDRGCLFDYDDQRNLIKDKAKSFVVEKSCFDLIEEPYRKGFMDILANFKRRNKE